jgi:hypothetical protein
MESIIIVLKIIGIIIGGWLFCLFVSLAITIVIVGIIKLTEYKNIILRIFSSMLMAILLMPGIIICVAPLLILVALLSQEFGTIGYIVPLCLLYIASFFCAYFITPEWWQ